MVVHLLKERRPDGVSVKCGASGVRISETSGFQSAVTCPACRAKMAASS